MPDVRLIDANALRPQNRHLIHDPATQRRRATKHGYYHEPWYKSYRGMFQRCYQEAYEGYAQYGGRGIKVCAEWHDINAFAKWVSASGYRKGLSIDRIDPDGPYSPANCKWSTPHEQSNNRRNTVMLTYDGKTMALADWADALGINRHTLWSRLNKSNWPVEKALSMPVNSMGAMMDAQDMDVHAKEGGAE